MSKQGIPETNLERIYFRISILMVLPTISLLFPDIWGGGYTLWVFYCASYCT